MTKKYMLIRAYKKCEKEFLIALENYCVIGFEKLEKNEKLVQLYQELANAMLEEGQMAKKRLEELEMLQETKEIINEKDKLVAKIEYTVDDFRGAKKILSEDILPGSISYYDYWVRNYSEAKNANLKLIYCTLGKMKELKKKINEKGSNVLNHSSFCEVSKIKKLWETMEYENKKTQMAIAKYFVKTRNKLEQEKPYRVDNTGKIIISEEYKPYKLFGNKVNELKNIIDIIEYSVTTKTYSNKQLENALIAIVEAEITIPLIEKDEKNILLEKAMEIAKKAHAGQVDKAGEPYIKHPETVAALCKGIDEKIVAWLHDVIEDTDVTYEDLRKDGFGEEIIEAIRCVTKEVSYNINDYYERISKNDLARAVKIADLTHNSDISRIPEDAPEEFKEKMRKKQLQYFKYKEFLENC